MDRQYEDPHGAGRSSSLSFEDLEQLHIVATRNVLQLEREIALINTGTQERIDTELVATRRELDDARNQLAAIEAEIRSQPPFPTTSSTLTLRVDPTDDGYQPDLAKAVFTGGFSARVSVAAASPVQVKNPEAERLSHRAARFQDANFGPTSSFPSLANVPSPIGRPPPPTTPLREESQVSRETASSPGSMRFPSFMEISQVAAASAAAAVNAQGNRPAVTLNVKDIIQFEMALLFNRDAMHDWLRHVEDTMAKHGNHPNIKDGKMFFRGDDQWEEIGIAFTNENPIPRIPFDRMSHLDYIQYLRRAHQFEHVVSPRYEDQKALVLAKVAKVDWTRRWKDHDDLVSSIAGTMAAVGSHPLTREQFAREKNLPERDRALHMVIGSAIRAQLPERLRKEFDNSLGGNVNRAQSNIPMALITFLKSEDKSAMINTLLAIYSDPALSASNRPTVAAIGQNHPPYAQQNGFRPTNRYADPSTPRFCFNCDESGHSFFKCPKPLTPGLQRAKSEAIQKRAQGAVAALQAQPDFLDEAERDYERNM